MKQGKLSTVRRLMAGSAVFLLMLAGCAGNQVAADAPASSIGEKAVVVVSVTHDAETGRRAKAGFVLDRDSKIHSTRVLRSIEEVLGVPKGSDFDDVHGRVYVLDVEPGIHTVSSWFTITGMSRLEPRTEPPALTFDVRAGEVVYIGNLNLNHVAGRSLIGVKAVAGAVPEVRDRAAIDIPLAEKKVASIKGRVATRLLPLGDWTASPGPRKGAVE